MTPFANRLRQARRRGDAGQLAVEIGNEAPVALAGAPTDEHEHLRSVLRWIAGGAIGAIAGAALLGAAIYLGLDAQSNFAETPEFAGATQAPTAGDVGVNSEKGDRLVRPVDVIAAKQTFHADETIKVGDNEVVKPRLFTLVSTNLSTAASSFAANVPPFDPNRLSAGISDQPEALPEVDLGPENAEIAFTTRDLGAVDLGTVAGDLSADDVEAEVAAMLKSAPKDNAADTLGALDLLKVVSDSRVALGALPYAATGTINRNGPYGALEVRITPENVTTAARFTGPPAAPDRLVSVRHGESLEDVLKANGAPPQRVTAILDAFKRGGVGTLSDGQKVLLRFEDADDGSSQPEIARVGLVADEKEVMAAAIDDAGAFDIVKAAPAGVAKKNENAEDAGGISLYQSVYEAGLKQGLAKPIIDAVVSAFASDVDYQRAASPADSLEAFYSAPDDIDPKPQLLFASLTIKDQTYRYYRFRTPDDGIVDFYDDTGKSSRKFLLRKPIAVGEMTSPFGWRFHPILHYARMHNGVDWGAPIGTPVLAAGNGTIIKAEFTSGYGRRVEIQHVNGYVSTYSHMSGFGKGIVPGVHVTQGQVVGYLGQSGLATGPHLHYEVIINGNWVDPMGIKLARTREFDGKMLALFKKEHDRILALIGQAPNASSAVTAQVN